MGGVADFGDLEDVADLTGHGTVGLAIDGVAIAVHGPKGTRQGGTCSAWECLSVAGSVMTVD